MIKDKRRHSICPGDSLLFKKAFISDPCLNCRISESLDDIDKPVSKKKLNKLSNITIRFYKIQVVLHSINFRHLASLNTFWP